VIGISQRNQELGLELIDLMMTDFDEFKIRVDELRPSSRREIAEWFNRLYLYKVCPEGSA
jgi:hypothetical protein